MNVSILTLGCRVNQSESDIIEGNLKRFGWSIVELAESPDYCIVNTCTVTSKSDYQSRQLIRRAVRAGAKVIVTGCYSQLRPDDVKNIEGVTEIIDNSNKLSIINKLSNKDVSNTFNTYSRSRPYLKVQDGCNYSCSYCAVPMARGRSRSLIMSEVIKQAQQIETAGFKEIVLTGINLCDYGNDLKPKTNLSELLISILKETKILRIRLSSLEVKEVNDELLDLIQDHRVCKHLHIPLQSGDDKILRLMKRRYTLKDYLLTINKVMKKLPGIAFGTDVIVGFPGEASREFNNTKTLLEYIPLSYLHIFPFSPRPNTLAYTMPDQIPSYVKKERLNELKSLNQKKRMAYMFSQLNNTLDIIIEETCSDNMSEGTSSNYLKVKIPSNGYHKGTLVRVRATETDGSFIKGEPIESL